MWFFITMNYHLNRDKRKAPTKEHRTRAKMWKNKFQTHTHPLEMSSNGWKISHKMNENKAYATIAATKDSREKKTHTTQWNITQSQTNLSILCEKKYE